MALSGKELFFDSDVVIVSKTDLKGRITYANKTFADLAGVSPKEAVGQPHNFVRHPDMPRCIFKLLWEGLSSGAEVFAYVVNRSVKGDHYWVFAHVTPSKDKEGKIVGYHSNRRVPDRNILEKKIIPLYKKLLDVENSTSSKKDGLEASFAKLYGAIEASGKEYNHFITSIGEANV